MIIALSGYAGSGKNTAGNMIREIKPDVIFLSFADKIRELAITLNPYFKEAGLTYNEILASHNYDAAKFMFPEFRRFLETLGTKARLVFGDDFWVDQTLNDIDSTKDYVITDLRFANEYNRIKLQDENSIVIRIDSVIKNKPDPNIPSDNTLNLVPYDYIIKNDHTISGSMKESLNILLNANKKHT